MKIVFILETCITLSTLQYSIQFATWRVAWQENLTVDTRLARGWLQGWCRPNTCFFQSTQKQVDSIHKCKVTPHINCFSRCWYNFSFMNFLVYLYDQFKQSTINIYMYNKVVCMRWVCKTAVYLNIIIIKFSHECFIYKIKN